MTEIKICGLRRPEDARLCAELGVEVIGLNFWPGTPRSVDVAQARAVLAEWPRQAVAVFVDASADEVARVRAETGIEWVQLHGAETPAQLQALQPKAYKAIGVTGADDVEAARRYGGQHLLLDARVPGARPGGTGHTFDWDLSVAIARERQLTLAGGLHAGNVGEAIARARPFRVDTASGVESEPGVKDAAKLRAFVAAVRAAGDRSPKT